MTPSGIKLIRYIFPSGFPAAIFQIIQKKRSRKQPDQYSDFMLDPDTFEKNLNPKQTQQKKKKLTSPKNIFVSLTESQTG